MHIKMHSYFCVLALLRDYRIIVINDREALIIGQKMRKENEKLYDSRLVSHKF